MLVTAPLVFAFTLPATLGVLWLACTFNRAQNARGLQVSLLALGGLVALEVAVTAFILPHEPTVRASFSTRTAFGAHLKNALLHFTPLVILYVLVPLTAVVGLERELNAGRVRNVSGLLSGDRSAFHPRGVWFVRASTLGWLMTFAAVTQVMGSLNYMLDALAPGPYSSWFAAALYVRVGLWFALAATGLGWYSRRLQDLKRLAALMTRLQ